MNPGGNGGPGGPDSPMKISAEFIHVYPLKKPVLFGMAPSPGGLLLSTSTKMGSLDFDPVYSTLCPSITLTRSTSNFHSNMLE